jgi:hypothetical protein
MTGDFTNGLRHDTRAPAFDATGRAGRQRGIAISCGDQRGHRGGQSDKRTLTVVRSSHRTTVPIQPDPRDVPRRRPPPAMSVWNRRESVFRNSGAYDQINGEFATSNGRSGSIGNSVEGGKGRSCPRWHPMIGKLAIPIREARDQPFAASHSEKWVDASIVGCIGRRFKCMDDGIALIEPTASVGLSGHRALTIDQRAVPAAMYACVLS